MWKDTVLVRTGETVDILLDVTNPGCWMAHCHIAEHHESGMMFSFNVDPDDAAGRREVIVVGGGQAGLRYRPFLAPAGHGDFTILEAADTVELPGGIAGTRSSFSPHAATTAFRAFPFREITAGYPSEGRGDRVPGAVRAETFDSPIELGSRRPVGQDE